MNISIIIPTFNEEKTITTCLSSLLAQDPDLEIIVSDGGSKDKTCEIVESFKKIKLLRSTPGRAVQMNLAAKEASSDILCFLHADSLIPADFLTAINNTFSKKEVVASFFRFKTDSNKLTYRIMELIVRFRSEILKVPYGDQGIAVRKDIFNKLGGYQEVKILEDLYLVRVLKKEGKLVSIKSPLVTSIRKYEEHGFFRTVFYHWRIVVRDWLK